MAGARNIGRAAAHSAAPVATAVASRSGGRSGACSATDDGIFILDFSTLADGTLTAGGDFINTGLDWTFVRVTSGIAHGTQDGSTTPPFPDSYAMFTRNFGNDYRVECTVHKDPGITTRFLEDEILLRMTQHAHFVTAYENTLAKDDEYDGLPVWPVNGALGTNANQYRNVVPAQPPNSSIGIAHGDIFYSQIVGQTITTGVIRAGVDHQMYSVTDTDPSALTTGQPAIGFFRDDDGNGGSSDDTDNRKFGFSRIKIVKL